MSMNINEALLEQASPPIQVFPAQTPIASGSGVTVSPIYLDLKGAARVEFTITVLNGTGVTGSAITLSQATASAGTNAKALAFTTYYQNLDTTASSVVTSQTAVGNTFTTLTTSSKSAIYVIDILTSSMDVTNNFNFLTIGLGTAVNATIGVTARIYNVAYGANGDYAKTNFYV